MSMQLLRTVILCLLTQQALFSGEALTRMTGLEEGNCYLDGDEIILNKYKKHLENSTWIVPPSTLLAYNYVDGNDIPVSDQTVWIINKFDGGYFFGDSYTSINQVPSSHMRLVGSVTTFGNVYITFFPVTGSLQNTDFVNGVGVFKKIDGKYAFVMQMNSAQNSLYGLSHWSYMISVKKNEYFYQNLPGENMSVPEFISQF